MRFLHDETVRYMNSGAEVWTAMREIALPSELEIGEGYGKLGPMIDRRIERCPGPA